MTDFKIELVNSTEKQIAATLRRHLRGFSDNPLASWRWWSGFLWGLIFMSLMNIGDFHFCIGECDDQGVTILGAKQ